MSQRLLYNTKWLWCLLVIYSGPVWGQPRPVTVKSPPSNPSSIEAQAKFFQYRHFPTTEEFNQGHRLGSERHFTERHERARPSEGLFSAKVRWGDKKGGYGEHYWDLNHAGHAGNHGDDSYDGDDGSYHESRHNHPYEEHNDHSPSYGNDDYDPEKSSYEETGRTKRHHPKAKQLRKHEKQTKSYEEESKPQEKKRKNKEELEAAATHQEIEYANDEDEEHYEKPKRKRYSKNREDNQQQQYKNQAENESNEQQPKPAKEKNQFVLVVTHKDDKKEKQEYQPHYKNRQHEQPQFNPEQGTGQSQYLPKPQLPYESGAGVRQHQQPEVSTAATVPRLFLEPSTGHVVDRMTGQAYVLQPIDTHKNY